MSSPLLKSHRAAKISVLAFAARSTHSARLAVLSLLALFFFSAPARASWISFSHTNYDGTPNTNAFLVRPVGDPPVDAAGNVTATAGIPTRITPAADGRATNWFQQNNYFVTNTPSSPALFLGRGYVFRAPLDSGPTVHPAAGPGMLLSGLNYFVNLYFGSNATITYEIVTNALGGTPILSTNLPVLTNGFIRALDATNISAAMSLNYSNTLYSDYTTRIAVLNALSITNIYPTNAAGVTWASGRAYVSTNYDPLGTALAIGAAGTNYANGISNALAALHALSITNLFPTNAAGVSYASGRGYISTNYDALGAALAIGAANTNFSLAIGLAATNYTDAVSNALAAQIGSVGISAATATNINNAATGVIGTNGTSLTFKFSSTGTNVIQGLAQTIANTSSNSVLGNAQTAINTASNSVFGSALTQINTTSNSVLGTAQSLINNSSNAVLVNAQTRINTSSNSVLANAQTAINASSNSVLATAQTRINTSSNSLAGLINAKANTNSPIIWTPLFFGPFQADTNNEATNVFGGFLTILGLSVQEGVSTVASGDNSHAEGDSTTAFGGRSHAEGFATTAQGDESHVEGNGTTANGADSHAEGTGSSTSGIASAAHAEGNGTAANSIGAHSEGQNTVASGVAAHSEGDGTIASGNYSHAAGQNSKATNANSFVWADGTTTGSVTNKTFTVNAANGIRLSGGVITGNGAGLTNTTATNFGPAGLTLITNIAGSVAVATTGLTNAIGTNFPNGKILNQTLFYPTNDPSIQSNWFQIAKADKTNGFATGLLSTNTALEGSVSFGRDGQATNILATTNVIKFIGAGTSLVTNGVFEWLGSGTTLYTNRGSGARLAFSAGTWLLQTNGVTLYNLTAGNPIGTWTIVSGDSPAPASFGSAAIIEDGIIHYGYFTSTNLDARIAAQITASVTNAIATQSGKGTNTTLINITKTTWLSDVVVLSSAAGIDPTLAQYSTIAGGQNNVMTNTPGGWNFMGAGENNTISGGSAAANFLGSGNGNAMTNVYYGVIAGGLQNFLRGPGGGSSAMSILGGSGNIISNNTSGANNSTIIGGAANFISGSYSVAAGQNANIQKDRAFLFSDGTAANAATNSQFGINATNGLYVNGPVWLGANSTNNGVYYLSNAPFSLFAVTNVMPNFAHWFGNSNGLMVDIYYSNGVPFFKTLAP